jgi:hypothetical protein
MASPLSSTALIAALKKWNVPYKEYPGWQTRTRPGGVNPIGFVIHHTGGPFTESDAYLKFLFITGQSSAVPGPLCNFAIGPSGTVHIGSRGRTNNAGAGDWTTRQLVGAESYNGYSAEIKPGADDYSTANGLYWGVEICYPGTVAMKPAQYTSAVRLTAALMDAYGWTALSSLGHREHSRRKWDPGQAPMDKFRRDVRALLDGEDDDMGYASWSSADKEAFWADLHKQVWRADKIPQPTGYNSTTNPTWAAENVLRSAQYYARISTWGATPWQSPGVATYARDVVGWVDPNDPTKAKPVSTRYLTEVIFSVVRQMDIATKASLGAITGTLAEILGRDPGNALSVDEWKALLDERLDAAFAENVIQVDISVDQPEADQPDDGGGGSGGQ